MVSSSHSTRLLRSTWERDAVVALYAKKGEKQFLNCCYCRVYNLHNRVQWSLLKSSEITLQVSNIIFIFRGILYTNRKKTQVMLSTWKNKTVRILKAGGCEDWHSIRIRVVRKFEEVYIKLYTHHFNVNMLVFRESRQLQIYSLRAHSFGTAHESQHEFCRMWFVVEQGSSTSSFWGPSPLPNMQ